MRINLSGTLTRFLARLAIALAVTSVVMLVAVEGVRAKARDDFADDVAVLPDEVGDALDVLVDGGVATGPDGEVITATTGKTPPPSAPQNFLVVGTDSRANLSGPGFGDASQGCNCADVIMLVRVDPRNDFAYVLSIPRDTMVDIPGRGNRPINEALTDRDEPSAGVVRLIETVRQNFLVPVHHYVQVDFAGVEDIVNVVGGVTVFFYFPARDAFTGLNVGGGCQHLDGGQALAYSRSRHYQEFVDGRWKFDPRNSDISRTARQQDLLRRLATTAKGQVGADLGQLSDLLQSVIKPLVVDPTLEDFDLAFGLARQLLDLDPTRVPMRTLPVTLNNELSTVNFSIRQAEPFLRPLRVGNVTSDVRVRTIDGSGGERDVEALNDLLDERGFQVGDVAGGADTVEVTEIRYADSQEDAARMAELVARHLDGPHRLVPVLFVDGADVELVVGREAVSVLDKAVVDLREDDLPPTTTTTAPTTTSTRPGSRPVATSVTATSAPTATPTSTGTTVPIAEQSGIEDPANLNVPELPC